jgi:hypothetical protein
METLTIRKLADKSDGERVKGPHPETGEPVLINPATGAVEPWPLAGIQIEGDAPETTRVPTKFVARGRAEGWITVEGESVAHRPGGPAEDPWRVTHTFVQLDAIVLHTTEGDLRYRVTHQPDKYVDSGDDSATVTDDIYANGETRVDFFYDLEREG